MLTAMTRSLLNIFLNSSNMFKNGLACRQAGNNLKYKGVVFFGEPGTGKTTIAMALQEKIPNSRLFEISEEIIKRLASVREFPDSIKELLAGFMDLPKKEINREYSRNLFVRLEKKYKGDALAQILGELTLSGYFSKGFPIIPGARGLSKAKYLKSLGYLIVFLKTNRDIIIERRLKQKGETMEDTIKDLEEEEKIYKTSEIQEIADVVFKTDKKSTGSIVDILLKIIF